MAQKKTEGRVELMEKEMEELKAGTQRLPGLETSVEHLTQSMAKMMQSMNETQKILTALILPKSARNKEMDGEGSGSMTEVQITTNTQTGPVKDQLPQDRGKNYEGIGDSQGEEATLNGQYPEGNWRRVKKLEMPIFSGENPNGWLHRAERYFEVNELTEKEKLGAVEVSLYGNALSWLRWMEARPPFLS